MNRREFLNVCGKIPAWAFLAQLGQIPWQALAQGMDPQFFVLILAQGGMDVTLGLDPRVHTEGEDQKDVFLEYRPEQIIQSGGIFLAPAAEALKPYSNDLVIINGVNMRRDAGHMSNLQYLASGNGDGRNAFLPVEIAQATGQIGPSGILQHNLSLVLGNYETTVTDLNRMLSSPPAESDGPVLDFLDSSNKSAYEAALSGFQKIEAPQNQILRELVKMHPQLGLQEVPVEELISRLFRRQLAYQSVISLSSDDLDSHSNHAGSDGVPGRHWKGQKLIWSKVADIFAEFKRTPFLNGSLFDASTFMVVTEFSRTPYLNGSNGKDHNPLTNSVLLVGPQFKGGQVLGGSRVIRRSENRAATHIARPIDFSSGKMIASANEGKKVSFVYPENIARTIIRAFGEPKGIASVDPSISILPNILK